MEYVYLFLVAVLTTGIGPVTSMSDACTQLSSCSQTQGATPSLIKDMKEDICLTTRMALDCFNAHLDRCDEEKVVNAVKPKMETMARTLRAKCPEDLDGAAGLGSSDLSPACNRLKNCVRKEIADMVEMKDVEGLCREVPKLLACFKENEDQCEDMVLRDDMNKGFETVMANYKKECNGKGNLTSSISSVFLSVCAVLVFLELSRLSL